ncbi:MAG: UDP-N-acetylglucosamine--N-acetylmuramyl-(pentapeptide) pyrophosphoryl-undecaprenol N-acetylglucosamine transferase [Candidatus Uhrbacteria bacterium]
MTILFTGGGTLGSVTPLLAVAEELRKRVPDAECTWWGTRHGPERQLVEAAGISFRAIPAGKLRRYWDPQNLIDGLVVLWAFMVAFVLLRRLRPSIVVGAGSYVQVPVMWAARFLHIPIVIHQLDLQPSLANRLVARFAKQVTTTFKRDRTVFGNGAIVIGTPVRASVLEVKNLQSEVAKQRLDIAANRSVVLVLGGGTGASALNRLVWDSLPELCARCDIVHVTGVGKSLASAVRSGYHQYEFLSEQLGDAYAAADIVVTRAGIGTLSELGVLGKATIVIPMPGTHQEENADLLERHDAAVVLDQRKLTGVSFAHQVLAIMDDQHIRSRIQRNITQLFPRDAAGRLAEIILSA